MQRIVLLVVPLIFLASCGAKPCEPETLAAAVDSVERQRDAHPAWFGDPTNGRLSTPLVVEELGKACPALPPDLRYELERQARIWESENDLVRPHQSVSNAYAARRDKVCDDPTVFSELAELPPDRRGPAVYARCGFAERLPIGSQLADALGNTYVFAPVFLDYLIDSDIDPALAKRSVELFGFPYSRVQTSVQHPRVSHNIYPLPMGGLLVRATPSEILPVDGPRIPLPVGSSGSRDDLHAWVEDQSPKGGETPPLVLDFDGSVPVTTVAGIFQTSNPPEQVDLLTRDPEGASGSLVVRATTNGAVSSRLFAKDGMITILGPAGTTSFTGNLEQLAAWTTRLDTAVSVRIEPEGLDVQGLADLISTLLGPGCEKMRPEFGDLDDLGTESCSRVHYSLAP